MNMVLYFNKTDMVSFGKYLLSDERKSLITDHPLSTPENLTNRLANVSHADIENWKEEQSKG